MTVSFYILDHDKAIVSENPYFIPHISSLFAFDCDREHSLDIPD